MYLSYDVCSDICRNVIVRQFVHHQPDDKGCDQCVERTYYGETNDTYGLSHLLLDINN